MPKIKLSKYDECPENYEITCISKEEFYSVGGVCRKDGLLTEQKCSKKGDVCCRLTYEESEKRKKLLEQNKIEACEFTNGKTSNPLCLCNNNEGNGKIKEIASINDNYYATLDCTGEDDTVRFETDIPKGKTITKKTSFCFDVSDDQELFTELKTKFELDESANSYFCFNIGDMQVIPADEGDYVMNSETSILLVLADVKGFTKETIKKISFNYWFNDGNKESAFSNKMESEDVLNNQIGGAISVKNIPDKSVDNTVHYYWKIDLDDRSIESGVVSKKIAGIAT